MRKVDSRVGMDGVVEVFVEDINPMKRPSKNEVSIHIIVSRVSKKD